MEGIQRGRVIRVGTRGLVHAGLGLRGTRCIVRAGVRLRREGRETGVCFRKTGPEVQRFEEDEEQGDEGGGDEGVCGDDLDGAQSGAEHGAKGEGDAEAGADESHGRAAVGMIRDVGDDGIGQLDVGFAEAADHATGEESPKVRRGDPERDAADIPGHGGQQGATATMAIGEVADNRRCEGLEQREEGAEGTAEQDDVVPRIDGAGKGILVGIEVVEDAIQERIRGGILGAVKGKERGEEREDEGEGDLGTH